MSVALSQHALHRLMCVEPGEQNLAPSVGVGGRHLTGAFTPLYGVLTVGPGPRPAPPGLLVFPTFAPVSQPSCWLPLLVWNAPFSWGGGAVPLSGPGPVGTERPAL